MSATSPAPPESANILEVDTEAAETDSSYGDEVSSFSASLTSSVNNFVTEYGRVYHSFRDVGSSILPSDEQEADRLDLHHALILALLDGKLHWAPIDSKPQRVLDLGTCTGAWAIDFADQYPSAEVIGNDLTPIQPSNVPPNLKFIIDDIEEEWGYEHTPFDFIHARYLAGTIKDWPRLLKQTFESTKPGGWAEFHDWDPRVYSTDGSINEEHSLYQFWDTAVNRRNESGYICDPGLYLEKWVKDAGFVNVNVHKLPIPLGTWPKNKKYKRIGMWNYLQAEAGLQGIGIGCLIKSPGKDKPWTMEEVDVLLAKTRLDMKDPKIHGQYDFYVVYGQKPELE